MTIKRAFATAAIRVRKFWAPIGHFFKRAYTYYRLYRKRILLSLFFFFHIAGALSSIDAIMQTRTSQGAIAWAISLNTFPYVAVPAYWIFGHNDFQQYADDRKQLVEGQEKNADLPKLGDVNPILVSDKGKAMAVLETISGRPATKGNEITLLIDGEEIFDSICTALAEAKEYAIVQFYIIRADSTGQRLAECLKDCIERGVEVYLVYDAYGSSATPDDYFDDLKEAGVQVYPFKADRNGLVDLQVNYRNHRKLIVIDGHTAFVGGLNIGDEYLSKSEEIGNWRDTHVKVIGSVVPFLQADFTSDWKWATGEDLAHLNWMPEQASTDRGSASVLSIATGPADELERCSLMFQAAIGAAEKRIWISTPYFVPDQAVQSALTLAGLRGVDVRILIPKNIDSTLAHLTSFSYLPAMEKAGIKVYRYTDGLLHQKAALVDDDFAIFGSANLDNRSLRLNFETMVAVWDDEVFLEKVDAMFRADFESTEEAHGEDMEEAPFHFRLGARVSRLLAPIQ